MSPAQHPEHNAHATEIERCAYNAAFYELGLRWHWDSATYEALAADPCERARVRRYLESEQAHLLRAYDAEFLATAILAAKQRSEKQWAGCVPQGLRGFDWGDSRLGEIGA